MINACSRSSITMLANIAGRVVFRIVASWCFASLAILNPATAQVLAAAGQLPKANDETSLDAIPRDSGLQSERALKLRANYPDVMTRIDELIETLRGETPEQSLEKLNSVSAYYWPGVLQDINGYRTILPLPMEVGNSEISLILSNRRVLKLIEELGSMPEPQASALIWGCVSNTLPTYKQMFADEILSSTSLRQTTRSSLSGAQYIGFHYQISDNPDGAPTLKGVRLSLLSLAYIAGTLKLEGAQTAVERILAEGLEQRNEFYNYDSANYEMAPAISALVNASLYNRQVLVVAMVGTANIEEQVNVVFDDLLESFKIESPWQSQKLTAYDALVTPFDVIMRHGGDPDYSAGSIVVRHVPMVDDAYFDQVVRLFQQN